MRLTILCLAVLLPLSAQEALPVRRVPPDHPCAAYLNRPGISVARALLDCQRNSRSARPPLTGPEAGKALPPSPPAPGAPEP